MKDLSEQVRNLEVEKNKTYLIAIRGAHPSYMRTVNNGIVNSLNKKGSENEIIPIVVTSEMTSDYGDMRTLVVNPNGFKFNLNGSKYMHSVPTIEEEEIHKLFFENPEVQKKLTEMRNKNSKVILHPYKSTPALDEIVNLDENISLFGPKGDIVTYLDNKFNQFNEFKNSGLKIPQGELVTGKKALEIYFDILNKGSGVCIANSFGHSGSGNFHIKSLDQIKDFFPDTDKTYLINTWINNVISNPTCSGIVGNDGIMTFMPSDQILEDEVKYRGNIFPSILPKEQLEIVKEQTYKVGEMMHNRGYRGVYACDFVANASDVYLIEVNPREYGHFVQAMTLLNAFTEYDVVDMLVDTFNDKPMNPGSVGDFPGVSWSMYRMANSNKEPFTLKDDIGSVVRLAPEEEMFSNYGVIGINPMKKGDTIHPGATSARFLTYQPTREQTEKVINNTIEKINALY